LIDTRSVVNGFFPRGIRHIERRASTASMGDSEFDYSSDEYGGEGKATGRKVRGGFVLW